MLKAFRSKGRSITRDFLLGLVLTVVFLSTVVISVSYYVSHRDAAEQLNRKAEEVSDALSRSLGVPFGTSTTSR